MKNNLIALLVAPAFLIAQASPKQEWKAGDRLVKIQDALQARIKEAKRDYCSKLGTMVRETTTRVQLVLLDPDFNERTLGFSLTPYQQSAEVLKSVELPGPELKDFVKAVAGLLEKPDFGGGSLVHVPYQGIECYAGEELIFRTSFCWPASNYFVEYGNGAEWLALTDSAKTVRKVCDKHIPATTEILQKLEKINPRLIPK
jgi:hypothetical protein